MNRLRSLFFATLIACMLLSSAAYGQVATGFPPFGSFSNGIVGGVLISIF